jgi:hypothetical protein
MLNKSTFISLAALILVGIGVSRIKYEVVFLRKTFRNLESELEKAEDSLNVLSAEWSYLNDPKRLKKLCEKYLKDMRPMENSQIIEYESLNRHRFVLAPNLPEEANTNLPTQKPKSSEGRGSRKKSFDAFINNVLTNNKEDAI